VHRSKAQTCVGLGILCARTPARHNNSSILSRSSQSFCRSFDVSASDCKCNQLHVDWQCRKRSFALTITEIARCCKSRLLDAKTGIKSFTRINKMEPRYDRGRPRRKWAIKLIRVFKYCQSAESIWKMFAHFKGKLRIFSLAVDIQNEFGMARR
jgi:hypothetical protein